MLLVRGVVRRTGDRGLSIRATGAWELSALEEAWRAGGLAAVEERIAQTDILPAEDSSRRRRVLLHASGFRQSPYADIVPAGTSRKVWLAEQERRRADADADAARVCAPSESHSRPPESRCT